MAADEGVGAAVAARESRNIMSDDSAFRMTGGGGVQLGRKLEGLADTLREAGSSLVIIKFYDDCEDCAAMRDVYKEFVSKYPDILFLEANVEDNDDALRDLRIRFLPTFIAFKHHLEVGRIVNTDVNALERMIRENRERRDR